MQNREFEVWPPVTLAALLENPANRRASEQFIHNVQSFLQDFQAGSGMSGVTTRLFNEVDNGNEESLLCQQPLYKKFKEQIEYMQSLIQSREAGIKDTVELNQLLITENFLIFLCECLRHATNEILDKNGDIKPALVNLMQAAVANDATKLELLATLLKDNEFKWSLISGYVSIFINSNQLVMEALAGLQVELKQSNYDNPLVVSEMYIKAVHAALNIVSQFVTNKEHPVPVDSKFHLLLDKLFYSAFDQEKILENSAKEFYELEVNKDGSGTVQTLLTHIELTQKETDLVKEIREEFYECLSDREKMEEAVIESQFLSRSATNMPFEPRFPFFYYCEQLELHNLDEHGKERLDTVNLRKTVRQTLEEKRPYQYDRRAVELGRDCHVLNLDAEKLYDARPHEVRVAMGCIESYLMRKLIQALEVQYEVHARKKAAVTDKLLKMCQVRASFMLDAVVAGLSVPRMTQAFRRLPGSRLKFVRLMRSFSELETLERETRIQAKEILGLKILEKFESALDNCNTKSERDKCCEQFVSEIMLKPNNLEQDQQDLRYKTYTALHSIANILALRIPDRFEKALLGCHTKAERDECYEQFALECEGAIRSYKPEEKELHNKILDALHEVMSLLRMTHPEAGANAERLGIMVEKVNALFELTAGMVKDEEDADEIERINTLLKELMEPYVCTTFNILLTNPELLNRLDRIVDSGILSQYDEEGEACAANLIKLRAAILIIKQQFLNQLDLDLIHHADITLDDAKSLFYGHLAVMEDGIMALKVSDQVELYQQLMSILDECRDRFVAMVEDDDLDELTKKVQMMHYTSQVVNLIGSYIGEDKKSNKNEKQTDFQHYQDLQDLPGRNLMGPDESGTLTLDDVQALLTALQSEESMAKPFQLQALLFAAEALKIIAESQDKINAASTDHLRKKQIMRRGISLIKLLNESALLGLNVPINLNGCVFEENEFVDIVRKQFHMARAELQHCMIRGCVMPDSNLHLSRFSNCQFANCNFQRANMVDVKLMDCQLVETDFRDVQLCTTSAEFTDLMTSEPAMAVIKNCFISDCIMIRGEFVNARFEGCIIERSDFQSADLSHVVFDESTIENCNFCNANLRGASFLNVVFISSSSFKGANLEGAQFIPYDRVLDTMQWDAFIAMAIKNDLPIDVVFESIRQNVSANSTYAAGKENELRAKYMSCRVDPTVRSASSLNTPHIDRHMEKDSEAPAASLDGSNNDSMRGSERRPAAGFPRFFTGRSVNQGAVPNDVRNDNNNEETKQPKSGGPADKST